MYEGTPKKDEADRLRRYRGIVMVRLLPLSPEIRQEQFDQAREDLEAALRVDPADGQAMESLASLHEFLSARATAAAKPEEAAAEDAASIKVVTDFLGANPGSVRGSLIKILLDAKAEER